jgi:oligopeptide/dipeptide ABC transporter ATP-binding protein
MPERLLDVRDLQLEFRVQDAWVRAVDGVSLHLNAGETLGLVGESGCGKSVTAQSIMRLLPEPPARYPDGQILVQGRNVLGLSPAELRGLRGRVVSYIFQEPGAALNPVTRVGSQILEVLKLHRPAHAQVAEVVRLLQWVGIPAPEERRLAFPHQLSGGMQQRVMIAMALASEPALLVADEPTTALDVTIQAQILDLLRELRQRLGMAMLLITHNLGLVADLADRVAVMYAGQIVETGPTEELLRAPRHPYTRALLRSAPDLARPALRLAAIPGTVPTPGQWPTGCRFAPRCSAAQPACHTTAVPLLPTASPSSVRCLYPCPAEVRS